MSMPMVAEVTIYNVMMNECHFVLKTKVYRSFQAMWEGILV